MGFENILGELIDTQVTASGQGGSTGRDPQPDDDKWPSPVGGAKGKEK